MYAKCHFYVLRKCTKWNFAIYNCLLASLLRDQLVYYCTMSSSTNHLNAEKIENVHSFTLIWFDECLMLQVQSIHCEHHHQWMSTVINCIRVLSVHLWMNHYRWRILKRFGIIWSYRTLCSKFAFSREIRMKFSAHASSLKIAYRTNFEKMVIWK